MACLSAAHLLGRGVTADPVEAARWSVLRDARNGGRSLLRPTLVEFEQALPATEMLAARRLAMDPPAASAAPEPSASRAIAALPMPIFGSTPQPQSVPVAVWPAICGGDAPAAGSFPPGRAPSSGTGVVVAAPGVVLTAAHLVQGCGGLEVQAGLATFGGAEIRAVNAGVDSVANRKPLQIGHVAMAASRIAGFLADHGVRTAP